MTVELVRDLAPRSAAIVSVLVAKETAMSGTGFSFPLPEELAMVLPTNSTIRVTAPNGISPRWLSYDPIKRVFTVTAMHDRVFPLQVELRVEDKRVIVVISEQGVK